MTTWTLLNLHLRYTKSTALQSLLHYRERTLPKAPAPARMCEKVNCLCASRMSGVSASVGCVCVCVCVCMCAYACVCEMKGEVHVHVNTAYMYVHVHEHVHCI